MSAAPDARSTVSVAVDPPPGEPAPSELRAVPVASTSASSEEAGGPPEPPPPPVDFPIPPAPAGVDAKQIGYLESVCPMATMTQKDGSVSFGCRGCPPYSSPDQGPDGKIDDLAPTWENNHFCALIEAREGSFTKPASKQVLLAMESPYMISSDIATSAVVVEHDGERWRAVASSVNSKAHDSVLYRRSDGIDLVVGHDSFGGYFDGGKQWFYVLDFTEPQLKGREDCFGVVPFNAFGAPCKMFDDPTTLPPFEDPNLTDYEMGAIDVRDIDLDGKPEFVAEVRHVSQPNTPALLAFVRTRCKGIDHLPKASFMPSLKSYTLVFEYDGKLFQPTKATRKLLEEFRQAGPERWVQDGNCRGI